MLFLTQAARELISKPEHWMKLSFDNSSKTCFCVRGAIRHAAYKMGYRELHADWMFIQVAQHCVPDTFITPTGEERTAAYNDDLATKHEDIMQLMDCTIAKLEKEASTNA